MFLIEEIVNGILFSVSESVQLKRKELMDKYKKTYSSWSEDKIKEIIDMIMDMDITTRAGKAEYADAISKWHMTRKIRLPEDYETVRQTIRNFVKAQRTRPTLRNIDINRIASPGELHDLVDAGKEYSKKENAWGSLSKLYSENGYDLYRVDESDIDAFCSNTKKTLWCVRDPKWFRNYNPIMYYMVTHNTQPFALYHAKTNQIKNVKDRQMTVWPAEAKNILKYMILHLEASLGLKTLFSSIENHISADTVEELRILSRMVSSDIGSDFRAMMSTDAEASYIFAVNTGERFIEGEPAIKKDPEVLKKYKKFIHWLRSFD